MLLQGIPELISYREINEVLTQIIAVHSLFKSFQNTAIMRLMILPLCYQVGDMESSVDIVNKGEPSDRPTVKTYFLGHDFQHLSFLLNSFLFCFSSRCI